MTPRATLDKAVEHLGIHTDHKLSFDKHVSPLCKKASNQPNAMSRLHRYLGFKEKETINLLMLILITVPEIWHFCSAKSVRKIEKIQERNLK